MYNHSSSIHERQQPCNVPSVEESAMVRRVEPWGEEVPMAQGGCHRLRRGTGDFLHPRADASVVHEGFEDTAGWYIRRQAGRAVRGEKVSKYRS